MTSFYKLKREIQKYDTIDGMLAKIPRERLNSLEAYSGLDPNYYQGISTVYHDTLRCQNEMVEKDAHIDATIKVLNAAVGQMKYTLNTDASDSELGKRVYSFIERAIYHELASFDRLIHQMCLAFKDGTSFGEIQYYVSDDGFIFAQNVVPWNPKYFMFDTEGRILFSPELDFSVNSERTIVIPNIKMLVHRNNPEYGLYYGKSELSSSVWHLYNIKKEVGVKAWIVLLDRHGVPTPVCQVPRDMSEEEKENLIKILTNFNEDQAIVFTEGIEISFAENGINVDSDAHLKLVVYADKSISKKVLGQTLMIENDGVGSYAATEVHKQVNQQIINARCREIQQTLNNFIKRLVDLNFTGLKYNEYPYIEFYMREEDLRKEMELYKMCRELGIPFSKSEFYQKFEILPPSSDEDNALLENERLQNKIQEMKEVIEDEQEYNAGYSEFE